MVLERLTPEQIRSLLRRREQIKKLKQSLEQDNERSKNIRVPSRIKEHLEAEIARRKEDEAKEHKDLLRAMGGKGEHEDKKRLTEELRERMEDIEWAKRIEEEKAKEVDRKRIQRAKANLLRLANSK